MAALYVDNSTNALDALNGLSFFSDDATLKRTRIAKKSLLSLRSLHVKRIDKVRPPERMAASLHFENLAPFIEAASSRAKNGLLMA